MKLLKNRESGQALIMALILLALGSLLLVPLLWQAFANLKYHQLIDSKILEAYSADSGVQYALCKLYNKPGAYTDCPLEVSSPIPINGRSVDVTANYTSLGIYKVTSTATSDNGRSTTIESYVNLSAGAFTYVVGAKERLTITGATVNATDLGGANIHSNRDIVLTHCEVDGEASAVKSIEGEECAITYVCPSPPVVFPGDYSELYKTMALEGKLNYTEDPALEHVGTFEEPFEFGPAYVDANLTFGEGSFIRLTGTVYVTGEINVLPHTYLMGEENILAEKTISIEGGEYVSGRIPVVTSTAGNIELHHNTVNAVVYAPNGNVLLDGAVRLYGAVGGNTVDVKHGCQITYAAELRGRQDLPGGELHTIAYSFK